MFDRLLIPLDGSQFAERALEPGLALASAGASQVLLLRVPVYRRVLSPSAAGYGWIATDHEQLQGLNESTQYLETKVAEFSSLGLDILPIVGSGDAASAIVDTATNSQVNLIVLTTHGYSGLTRWMLGSVTERVLRSAPCPVLVIRHQQPMRRVLICLDGSKLAEKALEPCFQLASILAEQITLLRVDHHQDLTNIELGLLEMADSELCKELDQHPEKRLLYYLDCIRSKYQDRGLQIETAVEQGDPARSILEYAEENSYDLIAMATHGYTGLRRWVYGSVTEKVLRNVCCAMLVVRPASELLR